jgi:hypothetical protein
MRDKIGDHCPSIEQISVERDLAVIHSKIIDTTFETASLEGEVHTVEWAIKLALEDQQ